MSAVNKVQLQGAKGIRELRKAFMFNPLLSFVESKDGLPPFSQIKPEHVQLAVEQAIADCRAQVEKVLAGQPTNIGDSLCEPLTETDDRLIRLWLTSSN